MTEQEKTRICLHAELIRIVGKMDSCCALIKQAGLDPVRDQVMHIGKAIGQLAEILKAINERDPRLYPAFFKIKQEHMGSAIAQVEFAAREAAREGNLSGAIALLRAYLETQVADAPEHRQIASDEIVRFELIIKAQA